MLTFDTPQTQAFWREACSALGLATDTPHHVGTFAEPTTPDRAAFIDGLAKMARDGEKRGTAHLKRQFEIETLQARELGDYWLVTTTEGEPICVVRVYAVDIVPFDKVSEAFAASEGEGDLSLRHWREVHGTYFTRQCARWNHEWSEDELVVCESFEAVYPA